MHRHRTSLPLALAALLLLALGSPLAAQEQAHAPVNSPRAVVVSIKGHLPEARNAVVLLPRGYEHSARRYPVLYLLHGLWGSYRDWIDRTNLVRYTADLPLIVVLPDASDSWYANSVAHPENRYADYVAKDVVAYVDSHFRTLPFRKARYVAGLSMGGFGAYKLALDNPGLYSFVGSFSGAFQMVKGDTATLGLMDAFGPLGSEARRANDVPALIRASHLADPPYFYLDHGTSDPLIVGSDSVAAALREKHLPYEYHQEAGAHSWEFWNRRLPVMLRLIRRRIRDLP